MFILYSLGFRQDALSLPKKIRLDLFLNIPKEVSPVSAPLSDRKISLSDLITGEVFPFLTSSLHIRLGLVCSVVMVNSWAEGALSLF